MPGDIISFLILLALVVLFASLGRRAWSARRPSLKWGGV